MAAEWGRCGLALVGSCPPEAGQRNWGSLLVAPYRAGSTADSRSLHRDPEKAVGRSPWTNWDIPGLYLGTGDPREALHWTRVCWWASFVSQWRLLDVE